MRERVEVREQGWGRRRDEEVDEYIYVNGGLRDLSIQPSGSSAPAAATPETATPEPEVPWAVALPLPPPPPPSASSFRARSSSLSSWASFFSSSVEACRSSGGRLAAL